MPRISGIDIPEKKKIAFSLRYLYGVGPVNALEILEKASINPDRRTNELSSEEVSRLQKIIDTYSVEGDLRKVINQNVSRLKSTGAYRGMRHAHGLPTRGQRTRTNARTKRGKRMTIGALKKEALAKVEAAKKEKEAK